MENSEILPRIWQAVCTEDEARVVAMLPGTASELAGRAERPLLADLPPCHSYSGFRTLEE